MPALWPAVCETTMNISPGPSARSLVKLWPGLRPQRSAIPPEADRPRASPVPSCHPSTTGEAVKLEASMPMHTHILHLSNSQLGSIGMAVGAACFNGLADLCTARTAVCVEKEKRYAARRVTRRIAWFRPAHRSSSLSRIAAGRTSIVLEDLLARTELAKRIERAGLLWTVIVMSETSSPLRKSYCIYVCRCRTPRRQIDCTANATLPG